MQASIAAPAGAAADEPAQPAEEPSSSTAAAAAEPTLVERVRRLFRFGKVASLREDLADALSDVDTDSASFSPSERAMLHNILRLRETRVEDVMVPRADVEAIEESITLGELLDLFEKSGHSRMPVYCDTLDDPRGMIHIRDVVAHITRAARAGRRGRPRPAKAAEKPAGLNFAEVDLTRPIRELSLTRPVLFVPPSMLAADLMSRMQASRTQMALVIDEYGGTDGLVSLEDLVELVVGDIEDEHDDDEALITQVADGVFVVDARAEIEEVAELIGDSFNPGEHIEEVDTIGGMIFNVLGRIPARGEVVQAVPGYEFHVLEADPRRIRKVRIVRGRLPDRRRRPARSASE
jgi:CBS domain containing-hemolysin-like protein